MNFVDAADIPLEQYEDDNEASGEDTQEDVLQEEVEYLLRVLVIAQVSGQNAEPGAPQLVQVEIEEPGRQIRAACPTDQQDNGEDVARAPKEPEPVSVVLEIDCGAE